MANDLIARLESATNPDEAIDIEIAARFTDWVDRGYPPPPYSASIDAALTLVPEELTWELSKWLTPDGFKVHYFEFHTRRECQGKHLIPAIALVIACLRARENTK